MAMESRRQIWIMRVICMTAALSGFMFGYDTGVISGAILFIKQEFVISTYQESLIVAMVSIGAFIGAIIGGPISDKFGRKKIVLSSAILFVISAIGLASSPTINWLIIWRFIVGFAIGVSSATAPLYIAELSPRSMRGALVSLNQLFITIGILIAYMAGLAFSHIQGWREMFLIAAIPAAVQFFVLLFFPESPRSLIDHGFIAKGREVLERYRGSKEDADLEARHIQERITQHKNEKSSVFSKEFRPALLAGIGLTVIQQVTGINTVIYYAPTIFQFAGYHSDVAAILATTLVGIVNVAMTFVAIWLIDKVGRKPLLIVGLAGMVISLIALGLGFMLPTSDKMMGIISVVSLMVYVGCFAFSLGPNGWLINAEIYPLRVRGKAMGIATGANWAANAIVTYSFLMLISTFGKSGTFWLFGLIGIFGIWFIIKRIPETKGKSLEEIEEYWQQFR